MLLFKSCPSSFATEKLNWECVWNMDVGVEVGKGMQRNGKNANL